MSVEDCSTISPVSRQSAIGWRAVASSAPFESKMPARALVVPTSTPMKACRMAAFGPITQPDVNSPARPTSPACIAAVDKDDAARHQARRVRGEEEYHRSDLLDLAETAHRRAA